MRSRSSRHSRYIFENGEKSIGGRGSIQEKGYSTVHTIGGRRVGTYGTVP